VSLSFESSSSLTSEILRQFEEDAQRIYAVLETLRERSEVPESKLTLVIADDLVCSVNEHTKLLFNEEQKFSAERLAGMVAAKNLPQTEDYSEVVIVFDANRWKASDEQHGAGRLQQLLLVAHEMMHPLQSRGRYASGALDDVIYPSFTGGELARSLTRILADEYGADLFADLYLRQVTTAEMDGELKPVGIWEVSGLSYIEMAVSVVEQAHPLWPDIVDDYRKRRTDLATMWGNLVHNFEMTLTSLVHAQAAADAANGPSLLDDEPILSEPARKLYLGPFNDFLDLIRCHQILPKLSDTKTMDRALVQKGEQLILAIWQRLGLSIEEKPNRQWALWVNAPMR